MLIYQGMTRLSRAVSSRLYQSDKVISIPTEWQAT